MSKWVTVVALVVLGAVGSTASAFGAENQDGSFTATGLTVYQGP